MRISSSYLCSVILAVWATAGAAQEASTLWDHNGSQVSLSAAGARRQFHYRTPKAGLLELGVQPGTLLFDGRRNGDRYSGTAYVFSKGCGARAYAVAGPVSPDQRAVTMYGKAPVVNSGCHVIGYRHDILVFNLLSEANQSYAEQNTLQQTQQSPATQQGYDIEYDRWMQQFMSCFENQSFDVTIKACNSALSFPRLIEDDRSKLLQRRAALVVDRQRFMAHESMVGGRRTVGDTSTSPSNVSNATASREGDSRTSVIYDPSLLLGIGGLILLAVAGLVKLRQFNPQSAAIHNHKDEAPTTDPASNPSLKAENVIQLSAMAGNPPQNYIPNGPTPKSMALKLKRSRHSNVMGKIFFVLDARIDLNAEEHALVKKYGLGGSSIYESQARAKHREATNAHLESTREHPSLFDSPASQFLGLGKTLFRIGRASVSATIAAYSKNITVDSLIRGEHIKCDSMNELLVAENAIREAAQNLKGYLEEAATFDGREEVIEL